MKSIASFLVLSAALSLAGCEASPQKPAAVAAAKASAPPKYIETGTRISTDHPQVYPDVGVMSQSALQDAINDHTGPGYNQAGPIPSPQ